MHLSLVRSYPYRDNSALGAPIPHPPSGVYYESNIIYTIALGPHPCDTRPTRTTQHAQGGFTHATNKKGPRAVSPNTRPCRSRRHMTRGTVSNTLHRHTNADREPGAARSSTQEQTTSRTMGGHEDDASKGPKPEPVGGDNSSFSPQPCPPTHTHNSRTAEPTAGRCEQDPHWPAVASLFETCIHASAATSSVHRLTRSPRMCLPCESNHTRTNHLGT